MSISDHGLAREVVRWFERLIDLSPLERERELNRCRRHDQAVAEEVCRLLEADETPLSASTIMDLLQKEPLPPEELTLGPYQVQRHLGRGGFGDVYLAERIDGKYEERVAIKIIRGLYSRFDKQQFRDEARTLAQIKGHARISRIIDVDETPDGRPYLVLDFIEGSSITSHCDQRRLSVKERLLLFLDLCSAVQFCHRNLVLHCDLKPSNVVVDSEDELRLLDFGIARLVDQSGSAQGLGTRSYAAPEQLRGEQVSVVSDVYSLGVLLFEILSGTLPAPCRGDEIQAPDGRKVDENGLSALPSLAVKTLAAGQSNEAAVARGTTVNGLARSLRGDLDKIVAKAIHQNPDERYASAADLASDIRRYLDLRPVQANSGHLYRSLKFVRRMKWVVGGATIILLALAGGTLIALWQARVATEERELAVREATKARRVQSFILDLFELSGPKRSRGEEITVREVLDGGAERIRFELNEEPAVKAAVMSTIGGVYRNLGLYENARSLLQASREIRRENFGDHHPESATSLFELALLDLQFGELNAADTKLRQALEIRRQEYGPVHLDVAECLNALGIVTRRSGSYGEAESVLTEALRIRKALLRPEHPEISSALGNLAAVHHLQSNLERAEKLYREALSLSQRAFGSDHPMVADHLNNLGLLLRQKGDYKGAERAYRKSLEINRRLFGDSHRAVAISLANIGRLFADRGELNEAERLYREAIDIDRGLFPQGHAGLAKTLNNLGVVHRRQKQWNLAEKYYLEALEMRRKFLGEVHTEVAETINNLGVINFQRGDYLSARDAFKKCLEMNRSLFSEPHPAIASNLVNLGRVAEKEGNLGDAEELFGQALAMNVETQGRWVNRSLAMATYLALLHQKKRELAKAEHILMENYEVAKLKYGQDDFRTQFTIRKLRDFYTAEGRTQKSVEFEKLLESERK